LTFETHWVFLAVGNRNRESEVNGAQAGVRPMLDSLGDGAGAIGAPLLPRAAILAPLPVLVASTGGPSDDHPRATMRRQDNHHPVAYGRRAATPEPDAGALPPVQAVARRKVFRTGPISARRRPDR